MEILAIFNLNIVILMFYFLIGRVEGTRPGGLPRWYRNICFCSAKPYVSHKQCGRKIGGSLQPAS